MAALILSHCVVNSVKKILFLNKVAFEFMLIFLNFVLVMLMHITSTEKINNKNCRISLIMLVKQLVFCICNTRNK